jgi:proline dehydrogenase
MSLLRQPLLLLARSAAVKKMVSTMPVSSGIVHSYVPGESTDSAVEATAGLVENDLRVTLDFLGEDTLDAEQADTMVSAYLDLLEHLSARGLTRNAEVSVKLSAIGQFLPENGHKIALENARTICRAARNAGTTVTLDMEDHTTTDSTLAILRELRKDFPETGRRAPGRRCTAPRPTVARSPTRAPGSALQGAYLEPDAVAFQDRLDFDKSYVRCLKVLLAGEGYPMIAQPRTAGWSRSRRPSRAATAGRRARTSTRCSTASAPRSSAAWRRGETMRVYVPTAGVVRLPDETLAERRRTCHSSVS